MTEKLFWLNSYQTDFTANILEQYPAGEGYAVVLDRTCFYATSGGQPHDTGTLNEVEVTDVRIEGNRLIHLVSAALGPGQVTGRIQWARRFDHMQQHSGQHILSAAFYRLFGAETSSFHLGEQYCSIELSKPHLTEQQIRQAEDLANEVICSAAALEVFSVDSESAKQYPLRKQSDLTEALRIVKIGDFDLSPCSGTHLRNTAEAGMIFVSGAEKLSQTAKVTFLCGQRIRKSYGADLSILKQLARSLTTSFDQLPEAFAKLQLQTKEMRKELNQMKEEKLEAEALQLYADAEEDNGKRLLIRSWNRPYQEVRFLAQKMTEQKNAIGAFASTEERRIVFFRSKSLEFDLRAVFQKFLGASGAKGGGPPHLMEAGGVAADLQIDVLLRSYFEHLQG